MNYITQCNLPVPPGHVKMTLLSVRLAGQMRLYSSLSSGQLSSSVGSNKNS